MNRFVCIGGLLGLLWWGQPATAQPKEKKTDFAVTEYRNYDSYYERITYVGKNKEHFFIDTFLKDSTLYRTDNFQYVNQGIYVGWLAVRHGPSKVFYHDGQLYLACDYNMGSLNGPFIVYNNDGSIRRRELYRNGRSKKSVCYDAEGREQVCEAFYQFVRFTGNPKDLKAYLEKSLRPLFKDTPSFFMMVSLVINEIGQVTNLSIDGTRYNAYMQANLRKIMQDMPRWQESEPNWQPARMDGVAIPGRWDLQVYRQNGYWQFTFQ